MASKGRALKSGFMGWLVFNFMGTGLTGFEAQRLIIMTRYLVILKKNHYEDN